MNNENTNPIELAKQGDCKAINFLINRQLKSKGIVAKSILQNRCLRVILESETIPVQEKIVPFIYKGITGLNTDIFLSLEICGKCTYSNEVSWVKKFNFKSNEVENNDSNLVQAPEELISNTQESNIYPFEFKGSNGTLIIEDDKLRIIRNIGFFSTYKVMSRDILYSEILNFQYAPPQGFTKEGFFYFQLADNVPEITRKDSLTDENSICFVNFKDLLDSILPKISEFLSQKIVNVKTCEDIFLGDNGSLILQDSFITIYRNPKEWMATSVGSKNIPYRSITAVQFHKSTKSFLGYVKGFLQLTIQGGRETQGGIMSALSDENTVTFETEEKNVEFARAKKVIEIRIQQLHDPVPLSKNIATLDELEKLASLKEKGIITEDEFQVMKKKILGL